ncbi:hypothetical protein ACB092_11G012000 [Castanea dentata]
MPPNPCSALLPLTEPKKLEEAKAADDAKVKNRQIFHLCLPICRRGFVICGLDYGFCGFGGLWIVEVLGCGGGCELFCSLWVVFDGGSGLFHWVAMGCGLWWGCLGLLR